MYDYIGRPIVDAVLGGYNGTIFAYGHTARSRSAAAKRSVSRLSQPPSGPCMSYRVTLRLVALGWACGLLVGPVSPNPDRKDPRVKFIRDHW